jgi:putative transcriptional regulator
LIFLLAAHAWECANRVVEKPLLPPSVVPPNTTSWCSQAVILIVSHNETGSAGLILNRPTQYKVGDLAGTEAMCPEFAGNPLYLGGDVGHGSLSILHGIPHLQGAIEVVAGVYMGGYDTAKACVQEETMDAREFHL